jgi:GDP-L-fucose synthase
MTDDKLTQPFSLAGKRVWVAGHTGMVGGATARRLAREDCELLTVPHAKLDLRDQAGVSDWMKRERPDVVVVAAATVGGILANSTRPADFLYDNLAIETHIIHAAYRHEVQKLLFLGSACIYPREAAQPMPEEALLTGPLEPTNEWYAIAKIAGIKLCQAYRRQHGCDFISAQPNNLYGPGDNFDLATSHVIPALMRKAHEAKLAGSPSFELWGSGRPKREFLYVDDLADALVYLLKHFSGEVPLNIGTGGEVTIAELARTIADVVGFGGTLTFDTSRPDGSPRKLLDDRRIRALGWQASVGLRDGLATTYRWFLEHEHERRGTRAQAQASRPR